YGAAAVADVQSLLDSPVRRSTEAPYGQVLEEGFVSTPKKSCSDEKGVLWVWTSRGRRPCWPVGAGPGLAPSRLSCCLQRPGAPPPTGTRSKGGLCRPPPATPRRIWLRCGREPGSRPSSREGWSGD